MENRMTYQQTVQYLFNRFPLFQNIGAGAYKEGTENIATFCKQLDNPQHNYFTIHVAGTNGKGSVAHILASILQQAGYRVGLFTSPHLVDFRERIRVDGEILLNGENILSMEPIDVRRRVGMVFQRPAPFPTMSIYDNVLSGFALNGIKLSKAEKDATVERCLRSVALWDEVKDVLNKKGTFLSGGQQQRLCIARALAMKPDVLLMDEPTSALDPIATKHIEELLLELQKEVTILIVTHNMGQARRISSKSMFMYLGELVEYGDTETLFSNPTDERTRAYLTGKMG